MLPRARFLYALSACMKSHTSDIYHLTINICAPSGCHGGRCGVCEQLEDREVCLLSKSIIIISNSDEAADATYSPFLKLRRSMCKALLMMTVIASCRNRTVQLYHAIFLKQTKTNARERRLTPLVTMMPVHNNYHDPLELHL